MFRKHRFFSPRLISSLAVVSCCGICSARADDSPESTPVPAASQAAPTQALEEVLVTASKRESTVQSTPIALSALDSTALERNNITDLTRLPLQVPSLYVGGEDGFGSTSVAIRGIGSLAIGVGADEGVGVYVDGVYQGKPYGDVFEFVDIDRVEVLRGPQGTLYGRNATGGAHQHRDQAAGRRADRPGQCGIYELPRSAGQRICADSPHPGPRTFLEGGGPGSNKRDGWAYDPVRQDHPYDVDNQYGSRGASLEARRKARMSL